MIYSVKVINDLNESIDIELFSPNKTGLLISKIEGLGPPVANVNMTELSVFDGSTFDSARLEPRNIVISFILLETPTVEDSRLRIYRYFPIKRTVTLEITTDKRTYTTEGVIETVEPDIFSEQESCQVSILCPDPYLYSVDTTVIYFTGVEPMFTFPFINESFTENELVMGETNQIDTRDIFYDGTLEVGFTIIVSFNGSTSGLIIYDPITRKTMQFDDTILLSVLGSTFIAGDILTISTRRGKRYITLLRNGHNINLINSVKRPIDWITLTSGINQLSYVASGISNIDFRIEYRTAYSGA